MKSLRPIWISIAAVAALGLAGCSQSQTPASENSVNPSVEVQSSKIYIGHYNNGVFTGRLHLIDLDLYYTIIQIILEHGGDPSPENIDKVYDALKG